MSHDLFNLGNLPPQPLSKFNLEYGHFYFKGRILIANKSNLWQFRKDKRIRLFCCSKYPQHNRETIYGDVEHFVEVLSEFLTEEFKNPKSIFKELWGKL